MKVIVFDVKGKFAHFRKFYTNSSSLTYGVPPRTTIAGMIAAIMGFERDSYYEIFSSDKLKIGVKKLTPTKKILQTLNYIRATSMSELITPKDHTQVPFEILVGDTELSFRIYVTHNNLDLLNELEERIRKNQLAYPPYLGSANFGCSIKYIDYLEGVYEESKDYIKIDSVIRSEDIAEVDISNYSGKLMKERMPIDFYEGRLIKKVDTYIYDDDGKPLNIKVRNKFIKLENGENIIFL
jgi:CRISPR-associated protein Cas5h